MKFIARKQYVPGFFMINYNSTYAHSFNIRTMYVGLSLYFMALGFSNMHFTTKSAAKCGNERF